MALAIYGDGCVFSDRSAVYVRVVIVGRRRSKLRSGPRNVAHRFATLELKQLDVSQVEDGHCDSTRQGGEAQRGEPGVGGAKCSKRASHLVIKQPKLIKPAHFLHCGIWKAGG